MVLSSAKKLTQDKKIMNDGVKGTAHLYRWLGKTTLSR